MIGSLSGKLTAKHAPQVIVECHGVGYEVETPMSTFLELPRVGEDVLLHTHLLVREDAQILFGFRSLEERSLFRLLLKIPGVGKKTAERLIIEMRDKIDKAPVQAGVTSVAIESSPKSEAVDALMALGYKAAEVNKLIGQLDLDGKSAEDIIRLALRQVGG